MQYAVHNDLLWPAEDTHCHSAIIKQVPDIQKVMRWVDGRELVIQAGGNVGIWPLHLAEYFDRVMTFEPDEQNYKCLQANCKGVSNIHSVPAALGDKPGYCGLHRVPTNVGAHWVVEGDAIPVMTIDGLHPKACDLIYLDIEGPELKALWGAEATIERFAPTIVIEDKGLSSKYGIKPGQAGDWLALRFGYDLVEQVNRDKIYKVLR